MRQCKRVGIDLSWRCSADCKTCFYHFDERLHKKIDRPLSDIKKQIDAAKARGCDHVVLVGWGEPTIAPTCIETIKYCTETGMKSSIITNGLQSVETYEQITAAGLDHWHVSTHGLNETLDEVMNVHGAGKRQQEFISWLMNNNISWRSNTTLQKSNYKQLHDIAERNAMYGCNHFVSLGFLPHYLWNEPKNASQVIVSPKNLQSHIESAGEMCLDNGVLFTIRYHPM